jgi:nicotinamidase/pyrazinamidase
VKRVLVDVDTQRDFAEPGGALYVDAPQSVRAAVRRELEAAVRAGDPIIGSVDSHAYDAWEFADNGGPFPPHCVKGTPGWLRIFPSLPMRTRFVPLQVVDGSVRNLVGEATQGAGNRELDADALAAEACAGVGVYFEKEVYSLFANPTAAAVIDAIVRRLGEVRFDVVGWCTGGYCVDAAAKGLRERGYAVRVIAGATAPIGGAAGAAVSKASLDALGVEWVESRD